MDEEPPRRSWFSRNWKRIGKWTLITIGFHLLVFAELFALYYLSPSNREWREKRRIEEEAREKVQEAVKRNLRSPMTPTFDYAFVRLSQTDTDAYVVSGTVHAQNSFGAMIKNYYAGKARRHSNGEWVLVGDVVISEDLGDTLKVK